VPPAIVCVVDFHLWDKDEVKIFNRQIFFSLTLNPSSKQEGQMQPWHVFFNLLTNHFFLKQILLFFFVILSTFAEAQKIDSIYVNLYTDSLKKGTYNYINIDGKLSNGRYLPLDSTDIIFSASDGKFYGNQLWIDPNFSKEKVSIKAVLRSNPSMCKKFDIYIKKIPNPDKLKSEDEILNKGKTAKKKNRFS
jgi:hypothetical protein